MGRGWCETLGIASPRLEAVAGHREANTFALLLVALLERDEPATLADVAARFDEAGIADRANALMALRRCRPGRPPVYREGDLYALDPHDEDLALWVFQLGLSPPRVVVPRKVMEPAPLPGPDVALSGAELDEAWTRASLHSWSAQRLAVAVLDAHGGPLAPAEVVAAVAGRTKWHVLRAEVASFRYGGSPIEVLADGRWAIGAASEAALTQARVAVRGRSPWRGGTPPCAPIQRRSRRAPPSGSRSALRTAASLPPCHERCWSRSRRRAPRRWHSSTSRRTRSRPSSATSSRALGRGSHGTRSSAPWTCATSFASSTSTPASAASPSWGHPRSRGSSTRAGAP